MAFATATPNRRLEAGLLAPVVRHLRRRGFRSLLTEVPFYDYRIDVFGYSSSDDLTVAVELKLDKWRRAFEQALVYQLCADLSFVVMPMASTLRVDAELLSESGVGLIGVTNAYRCRLLLPAQPSVVVRPHYRVDLLNLLREYA